MPYSLRTAHTFVSGDRVEPGLYRDRETGAIVQVLEADELPYDVKIVCLTRLFDRVEAHETARAPEPCLT